MLKGIAASAGVSVAKVYKLETPKVVIEKKAGVAEEEVKKFEDALEQTKKDIEGVKERAAKRLSDEELAVFDAHLMMAGDPELAGQIKTMIENDGVNAEYATEQVANQMVEMFESMDNDYFRERAADIKDVTFRLKCNLLGLTIPDLTSIDEDSIIVAHDLTPSDTAQLNEFVKGFATEIGGKTSHSAIMANSLEIPAVVGCPGVCDACKTGDTLALDALDGVVEINPDEETIAKINALADGDCFIHGDLHLENVMLDQNNQLVLIDMMNVCKGTELYDVARTYFLLSYDSNIQRKYLEKMGYSVEDIMPYLDVILRVRENEMSCIY